MVGNNILFIDNDECLGYFSLISSLYNICITSYLKSNNIKINTKLANKLNNVFVEFVCETGSFLDLGFARPDLKVFLEKIVKLKISGSLFRVVMFTSAPRYVFIEDRDYLDWVKIMRKMIECYIDSKIDIYCDDYSGRTDGREANSKDGATYKDIELYLKKNNIKLSDLDKIGFIDDRVENVFCYSDLCNNKLIRIGVSGYRYYINYESYSKLVRQLVDKIRLLVVDYVVDSNRLLGLWLREENYRLRNRHPISQGIYVKSVVGKKYSDSLNLDNFLF